jgi:hypothetical protein
MGQIYEYMSSVDYALPIVAEHHWYDPHNIYHAILNIKYRRNTFINDKKSHTRSVWL